MAERFGRYETIRTIASGGMATVHLARAVGAGGFERLVAIKVMHPHIASEPDFVAMFLDEARLAARVRHPNVVPTIDVHEDPLFLVMDYIEGPSLHSLLRELRKQKRSLPTDVALRIFLDILAGLHAAHDLMGPDGEPLNLVHRDVSPHNMLIGVDGIARITDFGVARAESRLSSTRGNQVKGKLAYMSPEQVRGEPLDRRCDVYASAVVLYELLTGAPLFRADNDAALINTVVAGPKMSPRESNPAVSVEVDRVTMRALRADPEERYLTAAEFADALEDAARTDGQAIATPRGVSVFVRELSAHDAAPSGKGAPAPPVSRGSLPSVPTGDVVAALRSVDFSDASSLAAPKVGARGELQSSSSSSTNVGTLVGPPVDALPIRSKKPLFTALAFGGVALGGLIAFFAMREPGPAPAATGTSAASASSAVLPAATTPLTAQATIAPPSSAPSSSTAPSAPASATSSTPSTKSGAQTRPAGKPTGKPNVFRPDDL